MRRQPRYALTGDRNNEGVRGESKEEQSAAAGCAAGGGEKGASWAKRTEAVVSVSTRRSGGAPRIYTSAPKKKPDADAQTPAGGEGQGGCRG